MWGRIWLRGEALSELEQTPSQERGCRVDPNFLLQNLGDGIGSS
jgi:hypothetical protein